MAGQTRHQTVNGVAPAEPTDGALVPRGVPAFIAPRSVSDVRDLARMIALAEWAPECYRDLDGNYLQQKIELAIMHGASLGLGPIAAVQSIALINGMPSIWGDGALSVIEHSGLLEDMVEEYEVDDEHGLVAVCTMKRRGRATPIVNRFSTAMADHAGLTRTDGAWQSYPERMLRMRARSWTMRDGFADILRGLHIREEVEDFVETRAASARGPNGDKPRFDRLRRSPALDRPSIGQVTKPSNGAASAAPVAPSESHTGLSAAAPKPEQTFALVNAEGAFVKVSGAEALRAGFEQILFDKSLSAQQVLGVWESNEPARKVIEDRFGEAALRGAVKYLGSLAKATRSGGPSPATEKPAVDRVGSSPQHQSLEAGQSQALAIDPTWGLQKTFQHYRAALTALNVHSKSEITGFRQVNIDIEQRLRAKLPARMKQIDEIYQSVGLES